LLRGQGGINEWLRSRAATGRDAEAPFTAAARPVADPLSSGRFEHAPLAHALAGKFDPVGIVDDAIEDRIGKRRIANDVMPAIDRRLAGENNRARIVTILDDFEQIARLLGRERLRSPVIEDEEFDPADAAQQFGVAAVTARERERGEQPWNAMVEHGEVFFAGDVPQGAGEPTFTDTGRARDILPKNIRLKLSFTIHIILALENASSHLDELSTEVAFIL